ncbi:hypothetical protein CAS74_001381 [Pichia kudriavzevii]|uniref:Prefoldin subunit 6 n=1 Tax=Pichia kudriavzevii TaxID=4909 RepID=A0A099P6U2_PICKU|nr:uncharacterized protein C5L36_0A01890 [Pichia kudriavzevii]AWU73582.1 hypothetical protein C5L36_0A01890 [Pichia kudriavzevii]KGK39917.1 hypothetical protein JL09_g888 [Pichia kudriavzevii]ONH71787.1 Prefoldin subunit 6 [Pichia kudriavzevii]OUT23074.1 hypothetical protein CAS74_001381 [Pichia kudriavzevii]
MSALEELQGLQKKLQDLVQSRTTLETQYQENKIVKEELDTLDSSSNVYKLMGPVLLKQDKEEAEDNVSKRIDFITAEIEKIEKSIKTTQAKMQSLRSSLQHQ